MVAHEFDPHRSFSRSSAPPELERFAGDHSRSLIFRFRVSWGSKNSRNYPLKPNKMIGKRVFEISSAKSAVSSSPIHPIRVSKQPDRKTRNEELARKEDIAASGLLILANQNPWKVTKNLKDSDLNLQSRLLIGKAQIKDQIIPLLDEHSVKQIHSIDGLKVWVKDCDTDEFFQLKLKWWKTSTSYVFVGGWRKNFVSRRNLKKDDEIGLFWNSIDHMFIFSVLRRAKSLTAMSSLYN